MLAIYVLLGCYWLEGISLFFFHHTLVALEDFADEDDQSEDRNVLGDEDEMADFIVDEDVDGAGALVRSDMFLLNFIF